MRITVLRESEIRQCVTLNPESIAAVEEAFTALYQGRAVTPIMSIPVPDHHGEMHVKSAYIQGFAGFAVKVASGFFENPKRGLPSGSGLMLLFHSETGFPQAVLLDNGYLTHVRTGAAGAIAAKYLARPDIHTVGIIGAGRQARFQLLALQQVRSFQRVLVYARSPEHVQAYIADMRPALGSIPIEPAPDAETLVRQSDLVVTTTPSTTPIVRAEWLHAGLHITALGADNGHKQELYPEVLVRADRRICDLKSQAFRLGDHSFALKAGLLTEDAPVDELGELTAGVKPGRTSPDEITVCDLTGVGVQDTAIALLAYRKAVDAGLGLTIES
ncbi:MAG: cyclodeaminase [Anaerolineae bacterium]